MTPRLQSHVFRALVLSLLTLLAWVGSDLMLMRVEAALGHEPEPLGALERPVDEEPAQTMDVEVIARRNIFNSTAKPEAPAPGAAAPTAKDDEPVPASTLALVLRGTWIGRPTKHGTDPDAFAILEDPSTQSQAVYRVGDALPGGDGEVAEILPRAVKILRGGAMELLGFPEANAARTGTGGAAPYPQSAGPAGDEIRQTGPGRYMISQRQLEHTLSNLTQVMMQARAIPVEGQGFRIRSIKKGSVIEKLGLQNGDILRSVNGLELTSIEQAAKAYRLMRNETRLNLEIQRGGGSQSLTYEIR